MFGLFKKKSNKTENPKPSESTTSPEIVTQKIKLMKDREEVIKGITLKKGLGETVKSRVALVLDYSYSMDDFYKQGFVQRLVERLFPMGLRFDDNGAIDIYLFHNDSYYLGEITEKNFDGFINREVMRKFTMGGTEYAPVIKDIVKKYTSEKGDPAYVMFITDGDNSYGDKPKATDAIVKASKETIFWQFIGIGSASFDYLEGLDDMEGRYIDNANFFCAKDFEKMSDEELYNKMMDEYPSYLKEAKSKGMY